MGKHRRGARLAAGLVAATVLGSGLALGALPASAAPQHGLGFETPAQPYLHNPDKTDWVGSYLVNNKQVWCVQFAFLAPDSHEQYQPGEALKTKWGTELSPEVAADISYLLLVHAETKDANVASALGHLLHSWTAAPLPGQTPDPLDPANDFRHIAYDVDFHLKNLPPAVQTAVKTLRDDAALNHGPWTTAIAKPAAPQTIGAPGDWAVTVDNAAGKMLRDIPVKVTVTGGVLDTGQDTGTIRTPATGKPLAVRVTPTAPDVSVRVSVDSPADRPVVQQAIQLDTQRIVSTGGQKAITANVATTAGGTAKVTKTNEQTGAGIPGVSLRLTAADRTAPAVDQDGKTMIGPDAKPTVLVTGADGTVTIANLKVPQDVCVVEVAVPAGFEQNFDPANPPAACGMLKPGETLALTVANKPNKPQVPVAIPAGDAPVGLVHGTVSTVIDPAPLVLGLTGLLVILAGLGGLFVRRRVVGRR
jgi:hypothetical protein